MSNKINENNKIDKLIAFCLMKGVQPAELVTSIFEKEYTHIETIKDAKRVYLIISYKECIDDITQNITMRYTYNFDSQLQRVEQKINQLKYKIQWDRIDKLKEIIKSIIGCKVTDGEVNNILIKLLPNDMHNLNLPNLKLVA